MSSNVEWDGDVVHDTVRSECLSVQAAADKLSVLLSAVSASSSPQLACTDGMLDGLKTA